MMVDLGIVDEGASQEVPNWLGRQLRVALIHMQLPPITAGKLLRITFTAELNLDR